MMTQDTWHVSRYALPAQLFPSVVELGAQIPEEQEIRNCFTFPGTPGGLRVLFLVSAYGAVGFYRGWLPAREMAATGKAQVSVSWQKWRPSLGALLDGADVIVTSIPSDPDLLSALEARRGKALLVVDIDDRVDAIPLSNPGYRHWQEHWPVCLRFLRLADLVTVPTRTLRRLLSEQYALPNVAVTPNCVDDRNPVWDEPAVPSENFILGFTGSISHIRDITLLKEPVGAFLREHPGARFVTYGRMELYHALGLPRSQSLWRAEKGLPSYPSVLRSWQVGLCPLEPTAFNAGKSPLKAIELIAAGVYPICSSLGEGPYDELNDGITGWARREGYWDRPEGVLALAGDWADEIEMAYRAEPLTLARMAVLTEYVSRFCLSGSLGRLVDIYATAYAQLPVPNGNGSGEHLE